MRLGGSVQYKTRTPNEKVPDGIVCKPARQDTDQETIGKVRKLYFTKFAIFLAPIGRPKILLLILVIAQVKI